MNKGLFAIIFALLVISCGDGDVIIEQDSDAQLAIDSIIIAEYLSMRGYEDFKTTPSGVRYFVIDPGIEPPDNAEIDSVMIDESDIVTFDYIGMLPNDSIFDTSIKEVGDSIRNVTNIPDKFLVAFPENRTYSSYIVTYSESGWTFPAGFPYRTSTIFFGDGFKDGLAASLKEVNIGGKIIIAIPSSLAFGQLPRGLLIPENSVLIFEIFPLASIEQ